jgi:hypothetical protein
MTIDEFGRIVAFIEGAWGGEMAAKQRDAYWLILRESSAAAVMAEAVRLARSSRSRYGIPKPGELLGADDETPALLAWITLVSAIERHGHYDSVSFEDGVLAACVDALGGWMVVSSWPLSDETDVRFQRRDFERLYSALARRGAVGPEKFVGKLEQENAGRFTEYVPGPARIAALGKDEKQLSHLRLLPDPETK